jgi:hypothetical protein
MMLIMASIISNPRTSCPLTSDLADS